MGIELGYNYFAELVEVKLEGPTKTNLLNANKEMDKTLVRLNYEFNNIKIGLVTGLNNLSDAAGIRDIEKALIGNFVEKWSIND